MARRSLKKSIKKITKLSILLAIKEGYLLFRNFLGLIYHPFPTLRAIKKERDLSQALLISSTILAPTTTIPLATMAIILLIRIFNLSLPSPIKNLVIFANIFIFQSPITNRQSSIPMRPPLQ